MNYKYLLLFLCFFTPTFAQAANYTVAPLVIDRSLEKRDIVSETIKITNNEDRVIRVYASVNEIALDDGGGIKEFVAPSVTDGKTSITSWVEINRGRIELAPGETKELPLTIRINPNAVAGEYHALLGFGSGGNRTIAEEQVKNGQAPAVVLRIGLEQEVNEFLRLRRFVVERFVIDENADAITYELQNPSKVPITPKGDIIFYDSQGEEKASIVVNPEGREIPPKEVVTFQSSVPADLPVGKHKAFLSVEYGTQQLASVHDTQFFYKVPLQQLLIILGSLLLVSVVVAVVLHRRLGSVEEAEDGEAVRMYVREGTDTTDSEHDIDLKQK